MRSASSAQTFVVTAFAFPFSGATPGKEFVKKANGQPGPPASTSTLSSMSLVGRLVKEKDLRPGGSAKNVKLDDKGSQSGAAPGVATAAPPRPAAAYAPAGPGMSGALWLPRGPAGFPYSMLCQAYLKVLTNPMFGCAGLGVLGSVDLFPRRFEGSVSEERFGSRTRTVTRVKLDVKRSWQDGGLWMVTAVRDRTRLGPRGGA